MNFYCLEVLWAEFLLKRVDWVPETIVAPDQTGIFVLDGGGCFQNKRVKVSYQNAQKIFDNDPALFSP